MIILLVFGCMLFPIIFTLGVRLGDVIVTVFACLFCQLLSMMYFMSITNDYKLKSLDEYFELLNHLNTWPIAISSFGAGVVICFIFVLGTHLYELARNKREYYLEKDLAYLGFKIKEDYDSLVYTPSEYTYKSNFYYKKEDTEPNSRIIAKFAYNAPLFKALLARKSINTSVIPEDKKKEGFTGESLWQYKARWNVWEAIRLERKHQDKVIATSKYPLASYIYSDTLVRTSGPIDKSIGKNIDWERIEFFQRNNYEPGVVMQARNKTLEELNLVDGVPGNLAMEILG